MIKACVLHGRRDLRVEAIEDRDPGPDEVAVRVRCGGICGSDLHYFFSGRVGDFSLREPLILGHEIAGEVLATGAAVDGLAVGDKVAVNPSSPCGLCRQCRSGRANLCSDMRFMGSAARSPHVQGGLREVLITRADQCVRLPASMPLHIAAFAEPLAVALHAVTRAGDLTGRRVLIVGAGVIGGLVALCARQTGALQVCAVDITDEPLALLKSIGAVDETFNAAHPTKQPAALWEDFDLAFEAAGSPQALATAIERVRRGGRIVQIGQMPAAAVEVQLNQLMTREIDLVGSFRFADEFSWAVEYLASGRIDVEPLYTGQFTLDRLQEAFELAADRRRSMKVQIAF